MKPYLTESKLAKHLQKIFPGNEFIRDRIIQGSKNSRSRPDYFCPELKLIIEFDGYLHYTSASTIVRDRKKDENYISEGYRIVRIPYFIQLDSDIIKQLFGVDIKFKQSFPHGFVADNCILPADFCELGIERFKEDLKRFNIVYPQIIESLRQKVIKLKKEDLVLPRSLQRLIF